MYYFPSANGINQIFSRLWLPKGQPKAICQIIHGMSEHSGRYEEFAEFLNKKGLAVAAHDHIGHGCSVVKGQRYCFFGENDGWGCALADIGLAYDINREKWPHLPYFMLGHSMGSFLLRSYLLNDKAKGLSGVILSGSGSIGKIRRTVGDLLIILEKRRLGADGLSHILALVIQGGYNRRFKPTRTPADWLSSDPVMVDDYLADPLCRKLPTVGLYEDINRALDYLGKASNIRRMEQELPMLLLSGAEDPFGDCGRAVHKLYVQFQKAGCRDICLKLYPACRHALLYEKNRLQVFEDIYLWLNNKIS